MPLKPRCVWEESDGDLMGDGVDIPARLEGIAKPGAICLSEDAYRQVNQRIDLAVSDLGATQLHGCGKRTDSSGQGCRAIRSARLPKRSAAEVDGLARTLARRALLRRSTPPEPSIA